nr:MAG TPA: hypothetical protein [Caudoviricetes sp.]
MSVSRSQRVFSCSSTLCQERTLIIPHCKNLNAN